MTNKLTGPALIAYLRQFPSSDDRGWAADELEAQAAEIERLNRIIDSRPSINSGLPQTYIEWSHGIYAMQAARALEIVQ